MTTIDITNNGIMIGTNLITYSIGFDPSCGLWIFPLSKATDKEMEILCNLALGVMGDENYKDIIDTLVRGAGMWRFNWLDGDSTFDYRNIYDNDDDFADSFYEEMHPWFKHLDGCKEQGD